MICLLLWFHVNSSSTVFQLQDFFGRGTAQFHSCITTWHKSYSSSFRKINLYRLPSDNEISSNLHDVLVTKIYLWWIHVKTQTPPQPAPRNRKLPQTSYPTDERWATLDSWDPAQPWCTLFCEHAPCSTYHVLTLRSASFGHSLIAMSLMWCHQCGKSPSPLLPKRWTGSGPEGVLSLPRASI